MNDILSNAMKWLNDFTQPPFAIEQGHGHRTVILPNGTRHDIMPVRAFPNGYSADTSSLDGLIASVAAHCKAYKTRPLIRVAPERITATLNPEAIYGEEIARTHLERFTRTADAATKACTYEAFIDLLDRFTGHIFPSDVGNVPCSEQDLRDLLDQVQFQSAQSSVVMKNRGAYTEMKVAGQSALATTAYGEVLLLPTFVYLDIPHGASDTTAGEVRRWFHEVDGAAKPAPHLSGLRFKLKIDTEKHTFQLVLMDDDYSNEWVQYAIATLKEAFSDEEAVIVQG